MTDKPEITRNDQTAIAFLKKIMDRLAGERQAYDARVQQAILTAEFLQHVVLDGLQSTERRFRDFSSAASNRGAIREWHTESFP